MSESESARTREDGWLCWKGGYMVAFGNETDVHKCAYSISSAKGKAHIYIYKRFTHFAKIRVPPDRERCESTPGQQTWAMGEVMFHRIVGAQLVEIFCTSDDKNALWCCVLHRLQLGP